MKRLIFTLVAMLVFTGLTMAQMPDAITIEPENATAQDTIKLWLNTNHTCPDGALDTATNIHIHSGANLDGTQWQNVVSYDSTDSEGNSITALTQENDSMWYIQMVPAEFYSVPDTSTMIELDAVFNNGTWDAEGKDFDDEGNCTDFLIPLKYNVETTLHVNMKRFADTSDFDFESNSIYLAGSMYGWVAPGDTAAAMMTDEDNDSIYTWTGNLLGNVDYEYKYFYVPEGVGSTWDNGEWDGGQNRKLSVTNDMNTMNEMWGMFNIYFHVTEDGSAPLADAEVTVGDWTKMTDAEGMATLYSFPDDSVGYTVMHDDYEDYMSGVAVGYDHVDVMVDMSTASIGDGQEEVHFTMYPNPANRTLNIDGLNDVTRVEVYNTVGQQVRAIENINGSVQINTSDLKTGIYFVNFFNEKGVVTTQKFMKQ